MALANETGLLTLPAKLDALGLEDKRGILYVNFEGIENGRCYTLKRQQMHLADCPPASPPNRPICNAEDIPQLPPPPPRNGILRAQIQLARQALVLQVILKANPVAIVRSPPGTGKTSLLDLTGKALNQMDNTRVVRFPISQGDGLKARLERLVGVTLPDEVQFLPGKTWILVDDAQLAHSNEHFWKLILKDLEVSGCKRFHIVIAAAYDLRSQGTTPYIFDEYPHTGILDLKLTLEEAEELYDSYINNIFIVNRWTASKTHS